MDLFNFEPSTYQEVLHDLTFAMLVLLCIAFEVFYWALLPPMHRQSLQNLSRLNQAWLQVSSIGVLIVIAGVLVWVFQIHNQYDRYFVGWRANYDTNFIMPELSKPFAEKLDPKFLETARQNRETFMKELFYVYVHDRDPAVNQNKLTRFYEQVTKYWTTQLVEIVFYFMLIVAVVYLPIYRRLQLPCRNLVLAVFFLLLALAADAWLARKSLGLVKEITQEQIQDIHERWSPDLDSRLLKLSRQFGLKYE